MHSTPPGPLGPDHDQRTRLALIAFLLHAPGLKFLAGYRLHRKMLWLNGITIGATLVWVLDGVIRRAPVEGWMPAVQAWLIGHFGWSAYLAWKVYVGEAGERVLPASD